MSLEGDPGEPGDRGDRGDGGDGRRVLVVDGANVVGSRADGWWRDRAGAAARLRDALARAGLGFDVVVLVLEGAARPGVPAGEDGGVQTVHAAGSGDDAIIAEVQVRTEQADEVTVVTADRALRDRVTAAGGTCLGPSWLLART